MAKVRKNLANTNSKGNFKMDKKRKDFLKLTPILIMVLSKEINFKVGEKSSSKPENNMKATSKMASITETECSDTMIPKNTGVSSRMASTKGTESTDGRMGVSIMEVIWEIRGVDTEHSRRTGRNGQGDGRRGRGEKGGNMRRSHW